MNELISLYQEACRRARAYRMAPNPEVRKKVYRDLCMKNMNVGEAFWDMTAEMEF